MMPFLKCEYIYAFFHRLECDHLKNNPVLLLLFLFITGMWLAQASGLLIIRWMYPGANLTTLTELGAGTPGAWQVVRLVQLLHACLSMILPAILAVKWLEGSWFPKSSKWEKSPAGAMIFIPVLLFSLMPLLQTMYVFNQGLEIPGQLGESLKSMEDQMNGLINGILKDSSPGAMAFNIFLMVVVAAVAEELFFRGALQRFLIKRTGDEHLSIFISAVIFSSVHMQFYGFLPRLTLGILFGYLYYRTGRLIAPITGHALFNGLQIGTYYYAASNGLDTEGGELLLMPVSFTMVSTLLFFLMYYSFHAYTEKKE